MKKFKKTLAPPVLGKREIQTLDFFWAQETCSLSASNIIRLLEEQSNSGCCSITINTVQSTLERLWRKGLLTRVKEGKAYFYSCRYSKQEVISSLLLEIQDEMGQGDELVMLSGIVEYLHGQDSVLTEKILAVCAQHLKSPEKV
jgi:predicted transcriptional regulator